MYALLYKNRVSWTILNHRHTYKRLKLELISKAVCIYPYKKTDNYNVYNNLHNPYHTIYATFRFEY